MEKLFDNKKECCGCGACVQVCPASAIDFLGDSEGFFYPQIRKDDCIDCGLCKKICPFIDSPAFLSPDLMVFPKVFACKHIDDSVRLASSSGGAFTALSDCILAERGTVYGAIFKDDFSVRHLRADTEEQRNLMRGSKYVQGRADEQFSSVFDDLSMGIVVLFSGMPCQIAGLYAYLHKRNANMSTLYTCDFFCYGAPSPEIFHAFLNNVQEKAKKRASHVYFRCKEVYPWQETSMRIDTGSRYIDFAPDNSPFYSLFFSHNILRPSCYDCKFTNSHLADLTLFDFWGIDRILPEFSDSVGVSGVWVNTSRGETLFEKGQRFLLVEKSTRELSQKYNISKPSPQPESRSQFWQEYLTFGYDYIARHYANQSLLGSIKRALKRMLKRLGISPAVLSSLRKNIKTK